MANINETISEVEKLNPELARQLKKYVKDHSYGLVFEHNLPEAVRLYTKTPTVGDTVNIMPERGKKEKAENSVPWVVKYIDGDDAVIEHDGETKAVSVNDIVTLVSYRDVIYPGLREIDRVERGNPDDPYHMVINSENYHALEALAYCYPGKVDCIYIDPPYNTGAKDWKYNNDYVDGNDQYRHSKWLAFMERRLKLAKRLLNPKDSVLIVTIDEKEYARLGLLLEQTFPEARIQMVSIANNPAAVARAGEFGRVDEYAFFVMCGEGPTRLKLSSEWVTSKGRTHTGHIRWDLLKRSGTRTQRSDSPGCFYPIFARNGIIQSIGESIPLDADKNDVVPPEGCVAIWPIRQNGTEGNWQLQPKNLRALWGQGFVKLGKAEGSAATVYYLKPGEREKIKNGVYHIIGRKNDGSVITSESSVDSEYMAVPGTQWHIASHDSTQYGSRMLQDILVTKRFSFPKSLYAVHDTLKFFVANKPNALIVDFFAGSGTTLHAVNLLNAEDGGHRRCVCVTNNEVSTDEQKMFVKKGLRPGDDDWEAHGIARYVTWPRTKCSIEGVDVNGNPLKGNYGCPVESYDEIDGDVTDPETGKKIRGKVYKKVKHPSYPELADLKMSDGFKANAIFCELTYESAWPIRLDRAFDAIAPILWMQAGCRGPIIRRIGKSYLTTDYYGVLFDYNQASKFCEKVKGTPSIKTVYVVTDDQRRYSNMCKRLPNIEVHRLYETYLKTFEICGEGGLD